jgi:hypothetical protein
MSEDSKEQVVENQKQNEELSGEDLKQVAGGVDIAQDITINKAKTAPTKDQTAMDGYIRG